MLYYEKNQWNICTEKVKYIQGETELENYVGQEGKDWWLELTNKGTIEIVGFIPIVFTEEQNVRMEEVNQLGIGDGYSTVLSDYVIDNKFPNEINHILKDIENKKTKEINEEYFIDLDFRLSMSEMGL